MADANHRPLARHVLDRPAQTPPHPAGSDFHPDSPPPDFRPIAPEEYERLSPRDREQALQAYHRGVLEAAAPAVSEQLEAALTRLPPGTPVGELAAMVIEVGEAIMPAPLAAALQDREQRFGVLVGLRRELGAGIAAFAVARDAPAVDPVIASAKSRGAKGKRAPAPPVPTWRPYRAAGEAMASAQLEPGCVLIATFAGGMCAVQQARVGDEADGGADPGVGDEPVEPAPAAG